MIKPFIYKEWHAWPGQTGILLSDQSVSKLRHFATVDDAINWLFLAGEKETARALNAHKTKD